MTLQLTMRRSAVLAAMVLMLALYLANLTGMGMVSADEPRYAEIGREMCASGDWITPHLWGKPWFEKPALLYWMTGAAFRAGLGADLAPRLPVALLSVGFLLFFWRWLRSEWNAETAWYGAAMLATSAGWLAYSHTAVTDLPMSAFYSAAVMFAVQSRPRWIASGFCLGIAALGKGLVPIALFAPVIALELIATGKKPRMKTLAAAALAFCAMALPWYLLCTLRNGAAFPRVFFLEQTFGRFNSDALQHARPWWFYIPVALLLVYPWCPFLAFAFLGGWRRALRDGGVSSTQTLAVTVIFGFVFFSVMKNKLPGYLLPLLPATCALVAIGYVQAGRPRAPIAITISLLGLLPLAARVVPEALANGLRKADFAGVNVWVPVAIAIAAGLATAWILRGFPRFALAAALAGISFLWFQFAVFPAIDRAASARSLWLETHPDCAPAMPRSMVYGLQYYAGRTLAPCGANAIDRRGAPLYGTERR